MRAATGEAARVLYVAEPPPGLLQRPPVVVDCSVLVALLFNEPAAEQAAALLLDKTLHAPTLLPYEFANVAHRKQAAGDDAVEVARAMREYAEQRIALHAVAPDVMAALASRYRLSAYDAAYLWLAHALEAPLASFDRRLGEAAGRHLGSIT